MKVQAMVWTSITNPIPPTRMQFGYMDGEKAGSDLALDWEDLDFFAIEGSNGGLDDGLQILPRLLPTPLNHLQIMELTKKLTHKMGFVNNFFYLRPDPSTCLPRQNTKAPCTLWRSSRTKLEHITIAFHSFVQPERHDIQCGHEHQHMEVRHKLWELGVLELTDVSRKGIEVLVGQECN